MKAILQPALYMSEFDLAQKLETEQALYENFELAKRGLVGSSVVKILSVSNSTEKTVLAEIILLPEKSFTLSTSYRFKIAGTYSTAAIGGLYTLGVELGGVSLATVSKNTSGSFMEPFTLEGSLNILSAGLNGEVFADICLLDNLGTSLANTSTPAAVDLSQPVTFALTQEWDAAHADNTLNAHYATLTVYGDGS